MDDAPVDISGRNNAPPAAGRARTVEFPPSKAAAQPSTPRNVDPIPQRPENLPVDETRAIDPHLGSEAEEAPAAKALLRRVSPATAPLASTPASGAATRPRAPVQGATELPTTEPGGDLRRHHPPNPRPIDEADPYAR